MWHPIALRRSTGGNDTQSGSTGDQGSIEGSAFLAAGLLICATLTPEYGLCPIAPAIARDLDLGPIAAFDVNAACSGGAIGLVTALSLLAPGTFERVVLVASDTTTHHLAPNDATTRILFGDGAAALLIERDPLAGIAVRSCGAGC
jgi:3-oxoacyl-[acyl-carrier-protein] synthase-3